jgi:hypothetical protein
MRILILLCSFFLMPVVFAGGNEVMRYWHVTGSSSLEIHGATNVNTFVCASVYSKGKDVITERWDPESGKWEIFGKVYLNVNTFDCRNRMMNNDFQNTLQSDIYPEIKIEFLNLKDVKTFGQSRMAEGIVEITLAGKVKQYPITSDLILVNESYSILKGKQVFRFSDFGLEAPVKGFGIVRVQDEISVNFELILDQVMFSEIL